MGHRKSHGHTQGPCRRGPTRDYRDTEWKEKRVVITYWSYCCHLPHVTIKDTAAPRTHTSFYPWALNPPFFRPAFPKGCYKCGGKYLWNDSCLSPQVFLASTLLLVLSCCNRQLDPAPQWRKVTAEYKEKGVFVAFKFENLSFLGNRNNARPTDVGGNLIGKAPNL